MAGTFKTIAKAATLRGCYLQMMASDNDGNVTIHSPLLKEL
ncbi:MAG: hypothetical protein AAGE96_26355 [Cyanobacteria bacterium P01_G01_bin.19]